MGELLEYAPIAAAAFAIPQFLPQILKLRATKDTAGVSWSWAMLTSVNNAAWIAYFAFSGYWMALVPSTSATVLAGTLATMLALRGQARARPVVLISGWASLLILGFAGAGRTGLGALLTSAFILQVTPSIWTAYRTDRPTGLSRGTWMLIFGELSCWTAFGIHKSDPRLIILGFTGVTASVLMLARIHRTRGRERPGVPGERPVRGRRAPRHDRHFEPTTRVMDEKVDLAEKLALIDEHFRPKIVAAFNDHKVELVKVKGEFVWHSHPETDDLFIVLAGRITIQLRERDVELGPCELFVVPRGVEHCPRADEEAHVLLIEPLGTANTGDAGGARTAPEERI